MNHTAFCTSKYSFGVPTATIGSDALTTQRNSVPSIGSTLGSPSNAGVNVAVLRFTIAVCGMLLATIASSACSVPGTDAFTFSTGLSSGIFRKSSGSLSPGTYAHGPVSVDGPANQRPATSTYAFWLPASTNTRPLVLDAYINFVPSIGRNFG